LLARIPLSASKVENFRWQARRVDIGSQVGQDEEVMSASRSTRSKGDGRDLEWASTDQDLEYQILEQLEKAPDSMGSGNLHLSLLERDVAVSPATVGRVLRLMDHERLTAKVANRGRVLTPAGRRYLEELRRRASRKLQAARILTQMEPASRDEFRKLLDALRMIEGTMARLAALNATADDLREMELALEAQRRTIDSPGLGAERGQDFHAKILQCCGNRFLVAAAQFIWSSNELVRNLWYQANDLTGVSSYSEHVKIFEAVARHQPDQAQHAMDAHFLVFMRALERYFANGASRNLRLPAPERGRAGRASSRATAPRR
jgi:GntR family transcriptional repressor for pyruvate dehydrogenase complex